MRTVYKQAPLLIATLLSACVSQKANLVEPSPLPRAEQEKNIAKLSRFSLSGAIAARNQSKSFTASLHWQQAGEKNYQIRLFGPLGSGTVVLKQEGGQVSYQDGPKQLSSDSAEKLLAQQTGVKIPVSKLYYWVRGLTAPGAVQGLSYDKTHHIDHFSQDGYTIEYSSYRATALGDLPAKISLRGQDILVKLAIQRWSIS